MSSETLTRRSFLRGATAGMAGLGLLWPKETAAEDSCPLVITEPFHGAVLNRHHGDAVSGGLKIRVAGRAAKNHRLTVNGTPARREGDRFVVEVVLREPETDLVAVVEAEGARHEDGVRVVWDRYSRPRYRFSIDDNSFFLRDIAQKGYVSLFDCFYLKMLRDLHRKYGTKFVLNIYYTTGDGFDLRQFPDRYRGQWRDNADWLKLAFHARANDPDRPYQDAPPERLLADLDLVAEQILRFAGEETYTPPTVIHWAMTRPTAFKPLASRGVRALSGYFTRRGASWDINYNLDDRRSEYLSRHDALKDFESGIVFSKVDIVCNNTPLERIVPTLDAVGRDPNQAEIIDLFTHEQYFWPFYCNYLPDHPRRLDAALRWVTDRGYEPVFFHEGLLGGRA